MSGKIRKVGRRIEDVHRTGFKQIGGLIDMKSPKAPKPTAQQIAVERRQAAALDEEIREQEERFRAMARGKLGTKSLLGGVPRTRAEAAGGAGRAAPARTMLGMGGMGGAGPRRSGGRAGPYNGTRSQLV
jgi:hypothetical protein